MFLDESDAALRALTHNSETEALTLDWPDARLACPFSSKSHLSL